MKKIILLYLALVNLAFAYNYDEVLLKAQASIFPKIMLLDKKLQDKLIDGKIVYTIVFDESDYSKAVEIKESINANYHGHLDQYTYSINLVKSSDFCDKTEATAIYVLNVGNFIANVVAVAKKKGIISFSYSINDLRKGLMFSLSIEKSTILYLEKTSIHTQNVDFVDSLLQMVRFIESDDFKSALAQYNFKIM
jgi:hypothetical protein